VLFRSPIRRSSHPGCWYYAHGQRNAEKNFWGEKKRAQV